MKQVEVTIMGQGYILGCPAGGETLLALAVSQVDHEMSAIRDGGKVKARERIAVLAALNLAYQIAEQAAASGAPKAGAAPHAESPGSTATPGTGTAEDSRALIASLMRRIDTALGQDGQLL